MTVNEARGEFEIMLEGVTYGLRPSYEAIVAFEKATGMSLLESARATSNQSLSVPAAAEIVTACMKAWGAAAGTEASREQKVAAAVDVPRVGALLVEEGMLLVTKRLEVMLFMAATGGVTSQGEAKAMPTTPTTGSPTPAPGLPASPAPL